MSNYLNPFNFGHICTTYTCYIFLNLDYQGTENVPFTFLAEDPKCPLHELEVLTKPYCMQHKSVYERASNKDN